MKWILLMWLSGRMAGTQLFVNQEFDSKSACEKAATSFVKESAPSYDVFISDIKFVCVPKGDELDPFVCLGTACGVVKE